MGCSARGSSAMGNGSARTRMRSAIVVVGMVALIAPGTQVLLGGPAMADPSVETSSEAPAGTAATVPDAPVAAAAPGDHSALVSWSVPADGGSPLTGFTVTTSPGGAQ